MEIYTFEGGEVFRWEFLPSGFIREENVHTRAGFGVGQQMKHVDIKATRSSVSETDRFTLAVNHITSREIYFPGLN